MGQEIIVGAVTVAAVVVGVLVYFKMTSSKKSSAASSASADSSQRDRTSSFSSMQEKYPAGPCYIYFGSQTGTAEGFARILMDEGQRQGFDAKSIDLEDFDVSALTSTSSSNPLPPPRIFLMATYGEGEPTDNAASFAKWMKEEAEALQANPAHAPLTGLRFTVFGLGNKQYEHYNKMGKWTNEFLAQMGGTAIYPYGEGDDDCSLEEDFESWKENLWKGLVKAYHPSHSTTTAAPAAASKVELSFELKETKSTVPAALDVSQMNTTHRHFFTAPTVVVTANRELRSQADGGSTRHIELDIANTGLSYHTADNLGVLPHNPASAVAEFAAALGYSLKQAVVVSPIYRDGDVLSKSEDELKKEFKFNFPSPATIETILTKYLDIMGVPRKGALARLLPYITDSSQHAWLERLLAKDNKGQFKTDIEDEGRSYYQLLTNELSSTKITLAELMHIVPFIQPRFYTIASSSNLYPSSIHLLVSVFTVQSPSGRTIDGLCSHYLQRLSVGAQCSVFVRESSFRLPQNPSTPIVMIGPGSGLAPMRALLQDRELTAKSKTATNILYFGCKSSKLDYLYREELENYLANGTLTALHVAFSREQKQKVYVQTLLAEEKNGKQLVDLLLKKDAYIYVCGGTSMGASVNEVITTSLVNYGGMTHDAAVAHLKERQKMKAYVQELWSV